MKKKKIYIAGSVRGVTNWQDKFKQAKKLFDFRTHEVRTPMDYPTGLTEKEYIVLSCESVVWADEVHVCPGYRKSMGTWAEIAIAGSAGVPVTYIKEGELT